MPHKISIDVTDIDMNQSLSIDKIQMPAGSRAVFDNNYTVVAVLEKTKEVAEFDAAQAAAEAQSAAASAASAAASAAAGADAKAGAAEGDAAAADSNKAGK